MTNKCHLFFYHYFPSHNQWLFDSILGKELYVVIDQLDLRTIHFAAHTFKGNFVKYFKLLNVSIKGIYLNHFIQKAERVCIKNVVFTEISRDQIKSECKYLTLKGCSNMQNMEHSKMLDCEQANLVRTEILKNNLNIFSDKLRVLTVRRTFSVDNIICSFLAFTSPFKNLKILDLSYNMIEFNGFCELICEGCVFANSL